jgi:hypothetical protein
MIPGTRIKPTCREVPQLASPSELERECDRLGELLEGLADLVAETRARRSALSRTKNCDDPRIVAAMGSLRDVERHLVEVGVEAASVHNGLLRAHLT